MQHVVRCGSITVAAAVHRYTEHVNDRLLTAACVLQVLLFLQEEEEESSPETQMKTNKGTCGSPLHICSFCFFLSTLSSSSPLLTGVSWYTGFYWSGPSSEESVCCLYQQRSPCVFMAKDWSETRAAQTAAGKHVAVRLQLMDWKTSWRLDSAAFLADWLLTFPLSRYWAVQRRDECVCEDIWERTPNTSVQWVTRAHPLHTFLELIANRFHGQRDAARAVIQVFIP